MILCSDSFFLIKHLFNTNIGTSAINVLCLDIVRKSKDIFNDKHDKRDCGFNYLYTS